MHIILVGTKAQLVKMAPVLRELKKQNIPHLFVFTGQHTETMDDLINGFGIEKPDDILVPDCEIDTKQKLAKWFMTAWMTLKNREYFGNASSIVVHGDTASTLLGALAGRKLDVPVAHVEAGLRSFDYFNPFPEEIVRVIVSRLASIHFCPGKWAVSNIKSRRHKGRIINTVHNTLLDSLRYGLRIPEKRTFHPNRFAVVSIHRYENLSNNNRFEKMMKHVVYATQRIHIKFVMHPVTKLKLQQTGWDLRLTASNVELINRMDYISFVHLLTASNFLITDGGSNQEEAGYMGLPCLLMRKKTERKEGLESNVTLANYDDGIVTEFIRRHSIASWKLNNLPDEFPSRTILFELTQKQKGEP